MKQSTRIVVAIAIIIIVGGLILTIDMVQRRQSGMPDPGSIPIFVKGKVEGYILPSELTQLNTVSFTDIEEGKKQDGWLVYDVLSLVFDSEQLVSDTIISISSSSRDKSVDITWGEITNQENKVMFDLSNKGTLKLVSEKLPYLDIRDKWIQDVDKIEVR